MDAYKLVEQYKVKGKEWLLQALKKEKPESIDAYAEGRKTLVNFLEKNNDVSIIPVLNSGLNYVPLIKEYVTDENIVLFRPAHTHNKFNYEKRFHDGTLNTNNKILLLENDIYSGVTLAETVEYFSREGYSKDKIYAYIHYDNFYNFGSFKIRKAKDWIQAVEERYDYKEFNDMMLELFEE